MIGSLVTCLGMYFSDKIFKFIFVCVDLAELSC